MEACRLSVCRLLMQDGSPVGQAAILRAIDVLGSLGLRPQECERLRAVSGESARRQSVGARLAMLWAMNEDGRLVHAFDELPTMVSDNARRRFAALFRGQSDEPLLEGGIGFVSFAHSASLAVCAFCEDGAIGVDVEPLARHLPHAKAIAERYFSPGERQQLAAAEDAEREFLRIWTRKEALAKALGTGLSADAGALDTTACPDGRFLACEIEGETVSACILK